MAQTRRHHRQRHARREHLCRYEMAQIMQTEMFNTSLIQRNSKRFVTQFGFHDVATSAAAENNGQPATGTPLAAARFEHCSL